METVGGGGGITVYRATFHRPTGQKIPLKGGGSTYDLCSGLHYGRRAKPLRWDVSTKGRGGASVVLAADDVYGTVLLKVR